MMGNVAIKMKIMPESPEVDMERLKKSVSAAVNVQDSKIEPVAFGLKSLNILIILPDKEGGKTDGIENKIRAIKGVADLEVESVTLL